MRQGFEVIATTTTSDAQEAARDCELDLIVVIVEIGNNEWLAIDDYAHQSGTPILLISDVKLDCERTLDPTDGHYCANIVTCQVSTSTDLGRSIDTVSTERGPHNSDHPATVTLTHKQSRILERITAGYSNPAIAKEFGTSRRTVEHAIRRLYRCLALVPDENVNLRVQAVHACRSGDVAFTGYRRGKVAAAPLTGSDR